MWQIQMLLICKEGWADIYGKAWGDKAPQVRKFLINEYKDKHVDKTGETPTEVLEVGQVAIAN